MTLPGPVTPATQRACPSCGAPLAADQHWCLSCGAAATTLVEPPPGWRTPAAIVTAVVLLVGAIVAFAFLQLSDNAVRVARAPLAAATPTPTPTLTPSPSATPTVTPTAIRTPTPVPSASAVVSPGAVASATARPGGSPTATANGSVTPVQSGRVAAWPAGRAAWTVVLLSAATRADADKRAAQLAAQGKPAGVLHSDDYSSLRKGYWVVFSGQYSSSAEAQRAAGSLGSAATGSYVRYVKP